MAKANVRSAMKGVENVWRTDGSSSLISCVGRVRASLESLHLRIEIWGIPATRRQTCSSGIQVFSRQDEWFPLLFCKRSCRGAAFFKIRGRDETGMPRTIEQQIKATYFALRIGAAVIAFVFPLLLWGGGKLAGFTLRDSMSAYYWASPVQLCPCGENLDHSCKKKGNEVDLTVIPSPKEQALEPGPMRNWFVGLL